MQRWSASSSADDSDSSQDKGSHLQDERLKRRQRVKRRFVARNADNNSNSEAMDNAVAESAAIEEVKSNAVPEKDSSSRWLPLKNAFRSLSLSSPKEPKPKPESKKILRSPVTHVYVKGLSGLPTHRVPLSAANFTDFCCVQRSVALRELLLKP